MLSLFEGRKRRVEDNISAAIQSAPLPEIDKALFVPARYDEQASEKTGFSNYSY